jgi:hypothetical protein
VTTPHNTTTLPPNDKTCAARNRLAKMSLLRPGAVLTLLVAVPKGSSAAEDVGLGCSKDTNPAGSIYSTRELATKLVRPMRISDLTQNLKVLLDNKLLLQPAFYTDEILKQFFSDAQVSLGTWEPSGAPRQLQQVTQVSGVGPFQGMTVTLKRTCTVAQESGVQRTRLSGGARFDVAPVAGFTVGLVRSSFGEESKSWLDTGLATEGVHYTRRSKGHLVYVLPGAPTSGLMNGTDRLIFDVKLDSEQSPPWRLSSEQFPNNDLIQSLEIVQVER